MRVAVALLALAGCAASPAPTPRARPPEPLDASPGMTDAAAVDVPPPHPAHLRVADALADAAELPEAEAAWLPSRVMGAIVDATGALPAPTPPRFEDGRFTWSLLAPPESRGIEGACAAVARVDPRVACAEDTVRWAGAERARVAVGWRATASRPAVTLAQPLRALSRLGPEVCLVHAQETLRTVDLTVRVANPEALGRTLAVMAVSPGMAGVILVRMEPAGDALRALLSWPSERAGEAPADLGDDPWPRRCDGASTVGAGVAAGTIPTMHAAVAGRAARGAVLALGRQAWMVTEGDVVGDAVVRRVEATRVVLTRRGRETVVRWAPSASR
jgi:hypothetical protein